jgi:sulfite reductase (NADPH) flavoprotein alpha-component
MTQQVPFIPDSAPFSEPQRAWLNGFIAGLFSNAPVTAMEQAKPARPEIKVIYASQSGTGEALARQFGKKLNSDGFTAQVAPIDRFKPVQLEGVHLFIASTYGDGDPPDHARSFADEIAKIEGPSLNKLRFSVLALGDSNYEKFCSFGKFLDDRFAELGAQRLIPRVEVDGDPDTPFQEWSVSVGSVLQSLGDSASGNDAKIGIPNESAPGTTAENVASVEAPVVYNRKNPFAARLAVNRSLTANNSVKEIRHFSISTAGSGIVYSAGDALAVLPENAPVMVDEILRASGFDGEEPIPDPNGEVIPLRRALTLHYDIDKVSKRTGKKFASKMPSAISSRLPAEGADLDRFLAGKYLIDLMMEFPGVINAPDDFSAILQKLAPRLYSIASSPLASPDAIDLCVAVVRYELGARQRIGVCSTFLADRVGSAAVRIFLQPNKSFRLPNDAEIPIIMVGPGTGIAPFRAFLQERENSKALAKSWLFFGNPHSKTDFLYSDEITHWQKNGLHLDLAFSRDQPEKLYVQHQMWERREQVWAWLQEGAYLFVCGDASKMAKDVDAVLCRIIEACGGKSVDAALEYAKDLRTTNRYVRDVY